MRLARHFCGVLADGARALPNSPTQDRRHGQKPGEDREKDRGRRIEKHRPQNDTQA